VGKLLVVELGIGVVEVLVGLLVGRLVVGEMTPVRLVEIEQVGTGEQMVVGVVAHSRHFVAVEGKPECVVDMPERFVDFRCRLVLPC
jgi:hypothetical protein